MAKGSMVSEEYSRATSQPQPHSMSAPLHLRPATPQDALTIAAVAIQVFLDTYATEGVRPDLAAEAFAEYSAEAFASRLQQPGRRFVLAEQGSGLVGFAEVQLTPLAAPVGTVVGAELVRLYIQPGFQRQGIGRRLLRKAEEICVAAAINSMWLTAWEGNSRALAFYKTHSYQDIGVTSYAFEGNSYSNRVFAKSVEPVQRAFN